MSAPEPTELHAERGGIALRGEVLGEGPDVVLLHGLTATRRYVVHRSRVLPRHGHRLIGFDARGHGESDAAPREGGYDYEELVADLGEILDRHVSGSVALAGHSMGAHTLAAAAIAEPERFAALVIVGPAVGGGEPEERSLAAWDALAAGLEQDGIDGFVAALGPHEPAWRETIERITRERMSLHRDLDAVARALRELPRSMPFGSLEELTAIEAPALVVASHDEADPGHPYAVAEAWAEALPNARLISEQRGSSPLAWQGGQLSREIADFLATDEVAERLSGD